MTEKKPQDLDEALALIKTLEEDVTKWKSLSRDNEGKFNKILDEKKAVDAEIESLKQQSGKSAAELLKVTKLAEAGLPVGFAGVLKGETEDEIKSAIDLISSIKSVEDPNDDKSKNGEKNKIPLTFDSNAGAGSKDNLGDDDLTNEVAALLGIANN